MNIPEKMKAVVARGVGKYALEEMAVPRAGRGEILIKVQACGICAGDAKAAEGVSRFWGGDGMPGYCEPPFVPGHEFFGTVVEVGEGMETKYAIGDRVISEQIVPCGECRYCKDDMYWLCDPHNVYGFKHYLNGGMAEYALLPSGSRNYKVPESFTLEQALLIEPYSCSLRAVHRAGLTVDDIVVLAGAGALGLGMVGALKKRNPKSLIVLDMNDKRLELAAKFGADVVINPGKEDSIAKVMELTRGYGCDVYIEATGHPAAVNQGLEMIRKAGRFVEFSVMSGVTTTDWSIIGDTKEITIYGSQLSPYCYPPTIEGIDDGSLPIDGVVTDIFPIEQWEEAFAAVKNPASIKVAIKP